MYLNEDKIAEDNLLPAMTSPLSERDDKVLFLKANEALDYGYVLEMMDRCRTVGATEVALITKAKVDEQAD